MPPLAVGLTGLGRWGRNYLRTLSALRECRLVAAADSDPRARAEVAGLVSTVNDHRHLLQIPELEAVVVATPDQTHFSIALDCLEAGKDVLVEKPLALSEAEAQELVQTAADNGRILAVGHTMVCHPDFEGLRNSFDAGRLGRPVRVTMSRTSGGARSPGSSVTQDLVPHDLAMAILLLGTPLAVRARHKSGRGGRMLIYQLQFAEDVVGSGWAAWRPAPHVRRFRLTGTTGSRVFEDAGKSGPDDLRRLPLTRQCLDFIHCCRMRMVPASDGVLGLAVTRCMCRLTESAGQDGRWVTLHGAEVEAGRVGVRDTVV